MMLNTKYNKMRKISIRGKLLEKNLQNIKIIKTHKIIALQYSILYFINDLIL